MSEAPAREWRFYVDDMIGFAETVMEYTAGLDQEAFVANRLVYDATLRNLELLGEAAARVPIAVRHDHPDVPWRMVVATRNRLIHGYLGPEHPLQGRPAEEVAVHEARSILESAGFNARAYSRSSYLLGPAGRYRLASTSTSTYSNQFALNRGCLKPLTQGCVSTAWTGWMRSL